ncbi:helix-turn-helix domain-containing protein [Caldalkalibacillus mannanilyticus]|uniref:helix-turn-helix domain-containing protein n=1 Tax=Caldalkalibacillus mannanilyticus TaxID=1418 RepID=UPI00046A534F|nr:helix-turn-helix domain-containing protein [Caldalkalibacillus mannanilyticus]
MQMQETLHRSLRSEIERNMRENGYTISKTAEISGINPGTLSDILNSNPPRAITIHHLDSLARAFGQPEGWLYDLYPEECLAEGKISRPRLIPYLIRCAEVGCQDCLELAVSQLLENPKHLSILYNVAERLYEEGKHKEARPFYEYVVENEKDSFSDQFIISQYRLFRLSIGTNSDENWKAVIRFEIYRKRLPENYQLDALLQVARVYYALHKWSFVEKFADELRELSLLVYKDNLRRRKKNRENEFFKTERHLVVYYGQGFLLKGVALIMREKYEEAKKYVAAYANLSWFEDLDELGVEEVNKFHYWGKANLYALNITMGNLETLTDYVQFLEKNPHEIMTGLLTIMKAANKYDLNVDGILDGFSEYMVRVEDYKHAIDLSKIFRLREQKYEYDFRKGRISQGIDELLHCLDLSLIIHNHKGFKRCVTLFWKFFTHASNEQRKRYQMILEREDE